MQRDPRKRVVTTKLAMEIAELNPLRFNEYVAADTYKCAPRTEPGKSRRFREPDLIGLWWFSKMLREGISAARAGDIACRLVGFLRETAGSDGLYSEPRVTFVETTGFSFFKPTKEFAADLDKDITSYRGRGTLIKATNFELAFVRQIIADKIEEWDNRAGDYDE